MNDAREKLEIMIYRFCKCYGLKLPRRYRKCARKEYLAFAKSRKHTAKKIRSALRRQLGYVKRDLGYLEQFMSDGYAMTGKAVGLYLTIIRLYEQQQYMYDNRVHSVEHRIVSISQPWLRPIVRGKVKAPVEFGAKVDKKQEYQDNTDRIGVERTFSLSKRCYGMSCITTKLEETHLTSIALSVFVTNLFRIQRRILYALLYRFRFWHDWNRCKSWKLQIAA